MGHNQNRNQKIIFLIYILGFIIIASSIALYQPLANTFYADTTILANPPDEHARFLVPKYICEHGVIPTGFEEEIRIPAYGFSYALYNVFPYIVQGYAMRFVSLFTGSELILLYVARFINVISGTLMAIVVYKIGKKLFQDKRFLWTFCFAVMYMPQSLFMHTYVNTDSMCMLSTSMMVYALVSAYKEEGFTKKNIAWLSGGIIICALSYYNAYGFILSSILLFLAYFLKKEDGKWHYNWKEMLKKGSAISALVLLGIGWWFARSFILYDGDFIGLATREKMSLEFATSTVMDTYQKRGISIIQMLKETSFMDGAYITFVGALGSVSIIANIWLYRLYKIFFVIGILGCLFHFIRGNKVKKVFFHINMIFCTVMPLALLIHYAYTIDFQNQGRYLLPAIVPIMYYVVKGIQKLAQFKWVKTWMQNVGVVFCLVVVIGGTLWMVYGVAIPIYLSTGVVLQ